MSYSFSDYYKICSLMAKHLYQKRSLVETRDALEYEEYKGIFSGWKLQNLREEYEEQKKQLRKLEHELLALCPTLEGIWKDLGWL